MKPIVLFVIFLVTCNSASAQTIPPPHHLEAGYGLSIQNLAIRGLLELKNDVQVEGTAVQMLAYEYRLSGRKATKGPLWLGLGLGYTQQTLNGSYSYVTAINQLQLTDTINFDFSRWSLVVEPRIYYVGLGPDWLEFWSSIRIGYKRSSVDANSTNQNIDELLKLSNLLVGNPINLSITPLGINLLPSEHLGISLAGNLGPTYFTRATVFVRF